MQSSSVIFFIPLCILIAYSLIRSLFSKDKALIWCPITFISLTLIYYIIVPSFGEFKLFGSANSPNQWLFYFGSLLFYACILLSFRKTKETEFSKWNGFFNMNNVQTIALVLFILAMVCYVPFRGFRTSISVDDSTIVSARTGLVSYFIDLISLCVGACCLALVGLYNSKGLGVKKRIVIFVVLYFTIILFIVGGFRYRIVILLLAMATTYHLYPSPRKINYIVFVPIGVIAYLGFAIMDKSRNYGRGIDMDVAKTISISKASKGAMESDMVFCFSLATFDEYYRNGDYEGIEPITTALCMPIPRVIFEDKPDGQYLKNVQDRIIGNHLSGCAYLVHAEAYAALGMIGVIIYGLFIGWLSKKIWTNYINNDSSIGAILLLSLFNGFTYIWISRGYMASSFTYYIYYVVLPFWITSLFNKICIKKI